MWCESNYSDKLAYDMCVADYPTTCCNKVFDPLAKI
jgi:hypothetical protein